jgi:hypothetical protein
MHTTAKSVDNFVTLFRNLLVLKMANIARTFPGTKNIFVGFKICKKNAGLLPFEHGLEAEPRAAGGRAETPCTVKREVFTEINTAMPPPSFETP